MALPVIAAAGIAAGANLVGQGINALTGANANKKNRAFAREQYDRQHADMQAAWHQQNEYNSPQAQMKRLQEAGLNPNMVYGNGSAVQTAAPVQTPDKASYDHKAAQVDLGTPVAGYFDVQMRSAQLDNAKAQNLLLQKEAMLKDLDIQSREFDLGFKSDTRDSNVLYTQRKADNMDDNAKITNENARLLAVLATEHGDLRVADAIESLLAKKIGNQKAGAEIDKIKNDIDFQKLEMNLKKMGINSSDPMWARMIAQLMAKYGIKL